MLSVSLVRDDQGKPAYFVAQLLDLTERNEIAEQLAQSQKMEAVGQLTGGIAHDFNNLLTVILGNARLLARRLKGDAATEKKLNAIAGAAERSASLTNRLLAFSRKEVLEPKLVDGGQLVTGMLDMMRRTLGETIGIRTNFADGPLNVLADPNLLEAALLNLANNARDAMPDGGTLSIHVGTADGNGRETVRDTGVGPGGFIVFTVSDSGSGISAENLDHIFEPFFTTKEVGQGTGLGLSMVFGFVKQSGGRIEVDSQEGAGTTFRIFLPKGQGVAVDSEDGVSDDEISRAERERSWLWRTNRVSAILPSMCWRSPVIRWSMPAPDRKRWSGSTS